MSSQTATPAPRTAEEQRALKLLIVLSRAANALGAHVARDVSRHGLTPTEFAVLEALHHKGPLLLGDVQRKILLSSGGITYTVDRLAEKGLVERRECTSDRRARYAALTPAGERLMERIFPEHTAAIVEAMSTLTAGEQDELIRLARQLGLAAADARDRRERASD